MNKSKQLANTAWLLLMQMNLIVATLKTRWERMISITWTPVFDRLFTSLVSVWK